MRAIAIDPIQLAVARSFGMLNTAVSGPDQVVDTVQLDSAPQSLILQIQASALGAGGSITVEIQTSPDGSTWTDAYSHEFADSGETSATIDGDLYVQATATPSGDTGHATVQVSCTPSIVAQVGAGGGSQPVKVVTFPFTFDTPDLVAGTPIYVPTPGDRLLDAWIEVATRWNPGGGYAFADIGTDFANGFGLFYAAYNATSNVYLTGADAAPPYGGSTLRQAAPNFGGPLSNGNLYNSSSSVNNNRLVPLKFTDDSPLNLIASTTGAPGGDDPAATAGIATVNLLILPAADFS